MTLRKRVFAILALVFLLSALAILSVVAQVQLSALSRLEQQLALRDADRVRAVFDAEMAQLALLAEDWGHWDATWDFAAGAGEDYLDVNMDPEGMADLGIDLVVLADPEGQVLFAMGVDRMEEWEDGLPDDLIAALQPGGPLSALPSDPNVVRNGLVWLDGDPFIVGSSAILRSDVSGESRGRFVFGRAVDREFLRDLRSKTRLFLLPKWLGTGEAPPEIDGFTIPATMDHEADAPSHLNIVDRKLLKAFLLYPDIDGIPMLLWEIRIDRDVYAQGLRNLFYLLAALAAAGAVTAVAVMVLIERLVLRPLARLSAEVQTVGNRSDLTRRVADTGPREFGDLARTFNTTLGQLEGTEAQLKSAHARAESLLLNILPSAIADRLRDGETTIAERYEEVSILFADLVGFTPMAAQQDPRELVGALNDLFSRFDDLAERHGLEKIKTIGDAYMAAAGVPEPTPDHSAIMARMALDMQDTLKAFAEAYGVDLSMRIGINSGPVIAGVIGKRKFIYDLWGDAVNIASRMESSTPPGTIRVTEATAAALRDGFLLQDEGETAIKGRGQMRVWRLTGRREGQD